MYTLKLLKGEPINNDSLFSKSISTKSDTFKKSFSSNNIFTKQNRRLQKSSSVKDFNYSIYDNFKFITRIPIKPKEKSIKQIANKIKQKMYNQINSIYTVNLKRNLIEKFNKSFLSSSSSNKNPLNSLNHNNNNNSSTSLQNKTNRNINNREINSNLTNYTLSHSHSSNELPSISQQNLQEKKFSLRIGERYKEDNFTSTLASKSRTIRLLKIFSDYKTERINKLKDIQINNLERIEEIIKSLNFNHELFINEYSKSLNEYVKFLKEQIEEEKEKLYQIENIRFTMEEEVTHLLEKIIKAQEILEEYISLRNFYIKVRERSLTLPECFLSYSARESKRMEIFKELNGLQSQICTPLVDKFLIANTNKATTTQSQFFLIANQNSINKSFEKQESLLNLNNRTSLRLSLAKNSQKKFSLGNTRHSIRGSNKKLIKPTDLINELPDKYKEYIDKTKNIFNDVNDFLDVFKNLNDKNMKLIFENNDVKLEKAKMKNELKEIVEDFNQYEKKIDQLVIEKGEKLEELKKKNIHLKKTLLNFKDMIYLSNKKEIGNQSSFCGSFISQETLTIMRYQKQMEKNNYSYACLVRNLIEFITKFLKTNYHGYDVNRLYRLVRPKEYEKIIDEKYIENHHEQTYDVSLKLLLLYENIVEFVFSFHNEYLKDPKLKDETLRLLMLKQREMKLNNARAIRGIIEKKRIEGIKEILEKNNKIVFITKRKIPDKFNIMTWKKKKEVKLKEKKTNEDNEYEDLLRYSSEGD